MSILIRDNQNGNIHEYGTNCHDALHISSDGSCLHYENLQNGDGSMCGGYSFVEDDGKIPSESETADAMHAMCYFNIGGFEREIVRCKDCRHRDPEDKKCDCGKMERSENKLPVHDNYFCAYGERKETRE